MANDNAAMKRMYAHALRGMASDIDPMITWPQISDGARLDLMNARATMLMAADLLKDNGEARGLLESAAEHLGSASYRGLPGRGEGLVEDAHIEVNHIRVELGYV